jgi:hypothetical protein
MSDREFAAADGIVRGENLTRVIMPLLRTSGNVFRIQ